MTSDADLPPTERIRPRAPVVDAPPLVRDPVVYDEVPVAYEPVDPAWMTRFDDRLRSLQTVMALLALVALAALGLSIYALIHDKPTNGGASQQHVAELESRVSQLEAKTAASATNSTTNNLAGRLSQKASVQDLQKLNGEVAQLQSAIGKATSAGSSAATSIGQLKGSVGQIQGTLGQLKPRVDQLSQQVSTLASKSTTVTTTTTP